MSQKERREFIDRAITHSPVKMPVEEAIRLARLVLRNAATVQRWAVIACNREMSASEVKRDEAAQARCIEYGIQLGADQVFVDGDPRGSVVRLLWDRGDRTPYNTWGGPSHGYAVPTPRY